jgi:hypothetical protein
MQTRISMEEANQILIDGCKQEFSIEDANTILIANANKIRMKDTNKIHKEDANTIHMEDANQILIEDANKSSNGRCKPDSHESFAISGINYNHFLHCTVHKMSLQTRFKFYLHNTLNVIASHVKIR